MKTYIRKSIPKYYIEFEEEIDQTVWEGKIGETYDDFLNNMWILLSDEQIAFHEENPKASIKEVINMELEKREVPVLPPPTLEQIIARKQADLRAYDRSPEVNSFFVNEVISSWLTADERANYRTSIESAKLLQKEELSLMIGDLVVTIPTAQAEVILAHIQMYADECYMVTKKHEAAISKLESAEEVEGYDFTQGYPPKLNFTL